MRFVKIILNIVIFISLLWFIKPFVFKYSDKLVNEKKLKRYFSGAKYNYSNEYIAVLKIPKINFMRGLYDINSPLNDVDKNIAFINNINLSSNSNTVIIGHSGDSEISYFKDLHKLQIGDLIYFYYNNCEYIFEVGDIYKVLKTGDVSIKRLKNKLALTLITCYLENEQLVIVAYKK